MLQVRCVESVEELQELRERWTALLDTRDPYSIYTSYEWIRAWHDAFGCARRPHVLIAEQEDQLLGVLPLQASRQRQAVLPLRRLEFMANGHSPCADLVCDPRCAADVLEALARHLRRRALFWDLAMFPEVRAGAQLARLHALYPEPARGSQLQRQAPFIPLHGSWDDYRSTISKRFLKVLRNNRNRVTKQFKAEVELFESPDAVEAGLPDMFEIGERSWQGQGRSAVGSTPESRMFYEAIARTFSRRGQVRLWFLKLDGRRVAFEFHLVHGGVEFGLKTGYDVDHEKLGAGTYLDQHIVERLFEEKHVHEYDLLGNCDFYKQRWTKCTRDYHRLTLYGGTWTARLLSLWNLRLAPFLRQQAWVQRLREAMLAQRTARQGSS
ncbi:MAG: GNAT family N-acetyltransferase [Candidatus Krumholzibacteriia bacterium]